MKKLLLSAFTFATLSICSAQLDSTSFKVLNGSSTTKNYITVPTPANSNLRLDTSWTIEALIYIPLNAQPQQVFGVESYSSGATGGFALRFNSTGQVQAYQIASPQNQVQVLGANYGTLGAWNHIAATMNESNNTLSVYLNGVLDATVPCAINTNNMNSNMYIGARGDDQQIWQTVNIDEVRVWNYARTSVELQNDRSKCLTGTEPGLLAYYNFEGATTSTIADKTGNGNTGAIQNFNPTALQPGEFKCATTTSVDEFNLKESVVLYPNPTSNQLTIDVNEQISSINIFNSLGKLVMTETNKSFSVESLPNGIYIIQINTTNNKATKKFIKQ